MPIAVQLARSIGTTTLPEAGLLAERLDEGIDAPLAVQGS